MVGGLPVLWLLAVDFVRAAAAAEPTWFLVVATLFAAVIVLFVLGIAAVGGLIGAEVGGWIAEKRGHG